MHNETNMKYFLLLGIVCLVVQANAARFDEHIELRKRCRQENGLPEDGYLEDLEPFWNDPKSKCYLKCFLSGNDILTENGEVNFETGMKIIPEVYRDHKRPLAMKCAQEGKDLTDRCAQAYEIVKCFYEGDPIVSYELGVIEPPKKAKFCGWEY